MYDIPYGFCKCGCGQKTKISKYTIPSRGIKKGEPNNFLMGHSRREKGQTIDNGYIKVFFPGRGYVWRSHIVAEKALGKRLPDGTIVHHINGDKQDDTPGNLVVCQDQGYHVLLHTRGRALKESGDPNKRKCSICHKYDLPQNMVRQKSRGHAHSRCRAEYERKRMNRKRKEQNHA